MESIETDKKTHSLVTTVYGKRLYVQLMHPLCCISFKRKDACVYDEDNKYLHIITMKKGQGEDVDDTLNNVNKETAEQVIAALMCFNTGLMDASNSKKYEPIFSPETWQQIDTLCSLVYNDTKEGICNLLNFIYNVLWITLLVIVVVVFMFSLLW